MLDQHFGENKSRDVVAQKVELVQIQDPIGLKRLFPEISAKAHIALFDSYTQRLREGQDATPGWFSKNSLLLQLIDQLVESKHIKKKLFLNYPFSVFQTRREGATKEILNSVILLKKSQHELFRRKIEQIHKEFKTAVPIIYSSLFQVYLREQYPSEFFIVEVPYLIPGLKEFQGLYLPQGTILDDLIVFMRDGILNDVVIPDSPLPILPINIACQLINTNMLSTSAMINNFYTSGLKWQDFFYIVSDHFTIHPPANAYAGPEIKALEHTKKIKVALAN